MGTVGANRNTVLSENGLSAADWARLDREVEAELNALPAPITSHISGQTMNQAARDAGLRYVNEDDLVESDIGSTFVITQPIMRSRMSNRRDPDAVEFLEATYIGRSSGAFAIPLFRVGNRTIRIEGDMPYERIYRRRR